MKKWNTGMKTGLFIIAVSVVVVVLLVLTDNEVPYFIAGLFEAGLLTTIISSIVSNKGNRKSAEFSPSFKPGGVSTYFEPVGEIPPLKTKNEEPAKPENEIPEKDKNEDKNKTIADTAVKQTYYNNTLEQCKPYDFAGLKKFVNTLLNDYYININFWVCENEFIPACNVKDKPFINWIKVNEHSNPENALEKYINIKHFLNGTIGNNFTTRFTLAEDKEHKRKFDDIYYSFITNDLKPWHCLVTFFILPLIRPEGYAEKLKKSFPPGFLEKEKIFVIDRIVYAGDGSYKFTDIEKREFILSCDEEASPLDCESFWYSLTDADGTKLYAYDRRHWILEKSGNESLILI